MKLKKNLKHLEPVVLTILFMTSAIWYIPFTISIFLFVDIDSLGDNWFFYKLFGCYSIPISVLFFTSISLVLGITS